MRVHRFTGITFSASEDEPTLAIHEDINIVVNNECVMGVSTLQLRDPFMVGDGVSGGALEVLHLHTRLYLICSLHLYKSV